MAGAAGMSGTAVADIGRGGFVGAEGANAETPANEQLTGLNVGDGDGDRGVD